MKLFERLIALEAALAAAPSATSMLEAWCGGAVTAVRVATPSPAAPLKLPQSGLSYRRVQLQGGGRVLVDADNWYDPSRLTAAMQAQLDTTTQPFGHVVSALAARRVRIASQRKWDGKGAVPEHVLEVRALLLAEDGSSFCETHEFYRAEILHLPSKTIS